MSFFKKWYTYQKERFPIVVYGLYVLCITFAVFCFSSHYGKLNIEGFEIEYMKLIPMFVVLFLQYLMIRIIDEFKDYEEDCKYRPYRPLPRGLVTKKELVVVFVLSVLLQVLITILVSSKSLIFLAYVWFFFGLMSKDFFMKKYLDKHILVNVFLDELLMPLLVLYLASFIHIDFSNIGILLLISYFVSWVVEIARKVRCKEDEEKGVKTYTAVLGIPKTIFILTVLEIELLLFQLNVLGKNHMIWLVGMYIIVSIINILFTKKKTKKFAKLTEISANAYIIVIYLSMGLLMI